MNSLFLESVSLGANLPRLNLELDQGVHACIAEPGPLFTLLLPCLAGLARPRHGRVTVNSRVPYRTPELRAHIGTLFPEETPLPRGPAVRDFLARVRELRGSAGRNTGLLDEEFLARPTTSLDPRALRLVALELALTTPSPALVALYDPWDAVTESQRPLLLEALSELGRSQAITVLCLHDERSARRFSSSIHYLGARAPRESTSERTVLISVERPRDIAGLLSRSPLVYQTTLTAARPHELRVVGQDDDQLMVTVLAAIREARCDVHEISTLGSPPRAVPGDAAGGAR